jgi:hypothetical protein
MLSLGNRFHVSLELDEESQFFLEDFREWDLVEHG